MKIQKESIVQYIEQPETRDPPKHSLPCVELAEIKDVDADGQPWVHWPTCLSKSAVQARTQIKVTPQDIGRECTMAFIGGDISRPIVLGLVYKHDTGNPAPVIMQSDDAIVLQSGSSRIELHADGRIDIQALYINSQAYGPHRIKGASVKIN